MVHDCDFHLRGLASIIVDYHLRGDGSEATAAARNEDRTPRIHITFVHGWVREAVQGKAEFLLPGGQYAANRLLRRPPLCGRLISKVATMGSVASLRTQ